jgi:hypothetical protein
MGELLFWGEEGSVGDRCRWVYDVFGVGLGGCMYDTQDVMYNIQRAAACRLARTHLHV